jgi:hypothetical protein
MVVTRVIGYAKSVTAFASRPRLPLWMTGIFLWFRPSLACSSLAVALRERGNGEVDTVWAGV